MFKVYKNVVCVVFVVWNPLSLRDISIVWSLAPTTLILNYQIIN